MLLKSLNLHIMATNPCSPVTGFGLDVSIEQNHDTRFGPYHLHIVDKINNEELYAYSDDPFGTMQALLRHFVMDTAKPILQLLDWDIRHIPRYIPHSLSGQITFWVENSGWDCNGELYECVHHASPDEVVYVFQLNSSDPFTESEHKLFREYVAASPHWFNQYGRTGASVMERNNILLSIHTHPMT